MLSLDIYISLNIFSIIYRYRIQYLWCHLGCHCSEQGIECISHVHQTWRSVAYYLGTKCNYCNDCAHALCPKMLYKNIVRLVLQYQPCSNYQTVCNAPAWFFSFTSRSLPWHVQENQPRATNIPNWKPTPMVMEQQRYPYLLWTTFQSSFWNLKDRTVWITKAKNVRYVIWPSNLPMTICGTEHKLFCHLSIHT